MKTGENGHFEFLGQKVKILAFSHKKLFKNVILIIGNYTNDIRSKNFKKKLLAKTKRLKLISNHSMVVRGVYYNPFQGSQGPQEGSKAKILTF